MRHPPWFLFRRRREPLCCLRCFPGVGALDDFLHPLRRDRFALRDREVQVEQDRAQRQHFGQQRLLDDARLATVHVLQHHVTAPLA